MKSCRHARSDTSALILTLTILISPCIPEFPKPIGMVGELEFLVWIPKRKAEKKRRGCYNRGMGKHKRIFCKKKKKYMGKERHFSNSGWSGSAKIRLTKIEFTICVMSHFDIYSENAIEIQSNIPKNQAISHFSL